MFRRRAALLGAYALLVSTVFAVTGSAGAAVTYVGTYDGVYKVQTNGTAVPYPSQPHIDVTGLAVDLASNVYASDYVGGQLLKVTPGGMVTSFVSGQGASWGVAIGPDGEIYQSIQTDTINKYTPPGTGTPFLQGGAGAGIWKSIAFDSHGDLFGAVYKPGNVANSYAGKLSPQGAFTNVVSGLNDPFGIAIDGADNLFVSLRNDGSIVKITPAGTVSSFASGLTYPSGPAFDDAGNLLVAEFISNTNGAWNLGYKESMDKLDLNFGDRGNVDNNGVTPAWSNAQM